MRRKGRTVVCLQQQLSDEKKIAGPGDFADWNHHKVHLVLRDKIGELAVHVVRA